MLFAMGDQFGVRRELDIAASGVRKVFTPHQPVDELDLLFGRNKEVKRILQQLNTPGQHCLLYGERGVGKSSLANVIADYVVPFEQEVVFRKRCDSYDTFESIVEKPLAAVGIDLRLSERTETEARDSTKSASVKIASYDRTLNRSRTSVFRRPDHVYPAPAAEFVRDLVGLLVIDEADAIKSSEDRRRLAEFIKHLSDSSAPLKVFVVGIAETASELTAGHASVSRCLAETRLSRLSDDELRQIVNGGARQLGLAFSAEAVESIVACSAGYPHFTHLLALKCAEDAVADHRSRVELDHVQAALIAARDDAEGTLKIAYEGAVRSYGTDMYRHILEAAASLQSEEFSADELRAAIEVRTGAPISQNSLNNYFQRLVSADGQRILRRMAKGVYRFSDPRMASYVRIASGRIWR